MVNDKDKRRKSQIGQSTHCASFGVSGLLPLPDFKPPVNLKVALRNYQNNSFGGSALSNEYIKLINNLVNITKIKASHYLILFKIILYLEEYEIQLLTSKHNLKNQVLLEVSDLFLITVPTLNEDDQFVTIGDRVELHDKSLNCYYYCKIIDIVEKKVYVAPYSKAIKNKIIGATVDVYFTARNWPLKCCHYVLHIMFKYKLIDYIYPKIDTNLYTLPEGDLDWVHKTVAENLEQKTAVKNILNNSAHPAPYIVFGPPGTGKTTTLVEAICQIRKHYKTKNILVCASSNAAADEIAKRLLLVLPPKDIFRMYAPSKHWNNLDKKISPSSNFVDQKVLYLPKEIFILKKIVITTLVTSVRLVSLKLRNDHFSYIFLDEASQSTELESLIPLTVIHTNEKAKEIMYAQIIVAGDPYQLGPIIRSKIVEHLLGKYNFTLLRFNLNGLLAHVCSITFLGKSLLERLMEYEPYKKVNDKYNPRYITKLVHNYRSVEPIIHTSNKLFYNKDLICYKKSTTHNVTSNWTVLSENRFPIIFFVVKGKEVRAENMSVSNVEEAIVVVECTKKLIAAKLDNRDIKQEDIGIVTPFREQKAVIERKLNAETLGNVTVGTVETFQGQEKEIILLTTVRSEVFKHNGEKHIGFLSNPKRFNVALTRAKSLLIIVGNPSILCKDSYWNTLWQYCKENNACVSICKNNI